VKSSPLALVGSPRLAPVHASEGGSARPGASVPAVSPPDEQAHQLFRAARDVAGLSQDRAAIVLGVSRRSVMRWEAGETPVPGWALVAMQRRATKVSGADRSLSPGGVVPSRGFGTSTVAQPGSEPGHSPEVAGSNPVRRAPLSDAREPLADRLTGRGESATHEGPVAGSLPTSWRAA
jgi:DNA-binding XRE family transcriptional regulator